MKKSFETPVSEPIGFVPYNPQTDTLDLAISYSVQAKQEFYNKETSEPAVITAYKYARFSVSAQPLGFEPPKNGLFWAANAEQLAKILQTAHLSLPAGASDIKAAKTSEQHNRFCKFANEEMDLRCEELRIAKQKATNIVYNA